MSIRRIRGFVLAILGVNAGLFLGDCAWDGLYNALGKLPGRAALAAAVIAAIWLWQPRKRTVVYPLCPVAPVRE